MNKLKHFSFAAKIECENYPPNYLLYANASNESLQKSDYLKYKNIYCQ